MMVREEPVRQSPQGEWVARLQEPLEDVGYWHVVFEANSPNYAATCVSQLKKTVAGGKGLKVPCSDHQWEFTSVKNKVYAKYLGE